MVNTTKCFVFLACILLLAAEQTLAQGTSLPPPPPPSKAALPLPPPPSPKSTPASQQDISDLRSELKELVTVVKDGFKQQKEATDRLETTLTAVVVRVGKLEVRVDNIEGAMNRKFAELLADNERLKKELVTLDKRPPSRVEVHHKYYPYRETVYVPTYYFVPGQGYYYYNSYGYLQQWGYSNYWCGTSYRYGWGWRSC